MECRRIAIFLLDFSLLLLNTAAFSSPSTLAVVTTGSSLTQTWASFSHPSRTTFIFGTATTCLSSSSSDSKSTRPKLYSSDDKGSMKSKKIESDTPPPPKMPPPSLLSTVTTLIGSTTSLLVAGTFYIVLCWKRDALMVAFFLGAISNGILSKVLKKILNVSRPTEREIDADIRIHKSDDLARSDNGMPSSHAMSLGFIGTFAAQELPWPAAPPLLLCYTVLSLRYRVKTKLHSLDQILVGVILGSFNGAFWHVLCHGKTIGGMHINVMEWVSGYFLNEQGLLPQYLLSVPALVGASVVGSIERRLTRYLHTKQDGNRNENSKGE